MKVTSQEEIIYVQMKGPDDKVIGPLGVQQMDLVRSEASEVLLQHESREYTIASIGCQRQ